MANRAAEYTEQHDNLRNILMANGAEYGDNIIDEICKLFNHPLTPEGKE